MIFGFFGQTTAIVKPELCGKDRALLDDSFFLFPCSGLISYAGVIDFVLLLMEW